MASDLNKVMIIGRMVRDPEVRYLPSGTPVADFTIASNKSYTVNGEKKEEVSFIKCTAWSKAGEIIAQYCKKGQRIGLDGRLKQNSWDDKNGQKRSSIEVVVDNFQFLSEKGSAGETRSSVAPSSNQTTSNPGEDYSPPPQDSFSDDDIPF
jgi:single-strand DNA-binding protein